MLTEWDYTDVARAYIKRPDYALESIEWLLTLTDLKDTSFNVCDIGAGAAHLTKLLAPIASKIVAVEPNPAMRREGEQITNRFSSVTWVEGTGEHTGQGDEYFDLVSFGSSFNVTDREAALRETYRILKPRAWFCCMWNHRNLEDPIQSAIEKIISDQIPAYAYGTRREDQRSVIENSGLFKKVHFIEKKVLCSQSVADCVAAWRSHVTLKRQAGTSFDRIIETIEKYLSSLKVENISVPYSTRVWAAQKNMLQ